MTVSTRHEPSPPGLPWAETGLLAPLPSALLAGRDLDLIAPLRFLAPGGFPALPQPSPLTDRAELAAALGLANQSYGHPAAGELARKLADPATRVVVTGQQPGLFGGPLYSFTKMLAAARWAAAIERAGTPAVAVFWVATEDHDWSEVAHAAFAASPPMSQEQARDFSLGPDPTPLVPVGLRQFGAELERVFAELGEFQSGPREEEFRAALRQWYRSEKHFGEAFFRLATALLGERCPLLLDAMLPAVKAAERPFLRALVERRQEVAAALARAEAATTARGYALQVDPQPNAGQLFVLDGQARRRVVWEGESSLSLRGGPENWSIDRLLGLIDENPDAVSPGALSRPAIQDALLGSSLFLLGPGELSYMAQASALYPVLGVSPPTVALRPQVLVLERALRRHLEKGDLVAVLDSKTPLERHVAERSGPHFVADVRTRVLDAILELRGPAMALDPNLERPLEKTREQIERALEAFSGKVDAAVARRDATVMRRFERLREACLPLGALQERVLSIAHFVGRYGTGFIDSMWEQLDLDPRNLQVITPDGPAGSAE